MSSIHELQNIFDNLEREFISLRNQTKQPENNHLIKSLNKQISQYNTVMMNVLKIINTKKEIEIKNLSS